MNKKRLLVLDDELEFVTLVGEIAKRLDLDVAATCDWREFQDAYNKSIPDIIVIDVVMPEKDGVEMAKWIANQGYAGRLIVVSGYNPLYTDMVRVLCKKYGFEDVKEMRKPLDLSKFRAALLEAV